METLKKNDSIGYVIRVLSPKEISANMLQTVPYNLNQMSFNAAISLIRALIQAKVKVKKVYVDTVGDPVKYRNYLQDMFVSYNIDFTVEKKADALYTCVSAASIVAKVFIPNPCFS